MDTELAKVKHFLTSTPDFRRRAKKTVEDAVNYALYPRRSSISELSKSEKTVIGIKWEFIYKEAFNVGDGEYLDCSTLGVEYDCKFTCSGTWMIPPECIGHICLLGQYQEGKAIRLGLIRSRQEYLNSGENRDKKKTFKSAVIKNEVEWILQEPTSQAIVRSGYDCWRYYN